MDLVVTYRRPPAYFALCIGALTQGERRVMLIETLIVFMTLLLLALVVCKRK